MFDHTENTTDQGNIGEARAIYEYIRRGWIVSKPINDKAKYDLLVDDGKGIKRVQVKTTSHKHKTGGYKVKLSSTYANKNRTVDKPRQDNDYDLLFVLLENGLCWSIPVEELKTNRTGILFGVTQKWDEYKL